MSKEAIKKIKATEKMASEIIDNARREAKAREKAEAEKIDRLEKEFAKKLSTERNEELRYAKERIEQLESKGKTAAKAAFDAEKEFYESISERAAKTAANVILRRVMR